MPRPNRCALVVKRRAARCHRRLLIASDFDEALIALPFGEIDPNARIALLSTYRVPFCGSRTLFGVPRLEREIAACTLERMIAFVDSTGLASSRFELLMCHGDPRDQVVREVRARTPDLVVLAYARCSCRAQQRIATRLLEETRSDVLIFQDKGANRGWLRHEEPVALGPWTL